MKSLNLLLFVVLMLSALFLVRTSYEARRLFAASERSQNEAARLESDYQRLVAERQAQSTNIRVEKAARERLQMRPISPAVTQIVQSSTVAASRGGVRP